MKQIKILVILIGSIFTSQAQTVKDCYDKYGPGGSAIPDDCFCPVSENCQIELYKCICEAKESEREKNKTEKKEKQNTKNSNDENTNYPEYLKASDNFIQSIPYWKEQARLAKHSGDNAKYEEAMKYVRIGESEKTRRANNSKIRVLPGSARSNNNSNQSHSDYNNEANIQEIATATVELVDALSAAFTRTPEQRQQAFARRQMKQLYSEGEREQEKINMLRQKPLEGLKRKQKKAVNLILNELEIKTPSNSGLIPIEYKDKSALVNQAGEFIIPFGIYEYIQGFDSYNYASAKRSSDNKYVYINTNGEEITREDYYKLRGSTYERTEEGFTTPNSENYKLKNNKGEVVFEIKTLVDELKSKIWDDLKKWESHSIANSRAMGMTYDINDHYDRETRGILYSISIFEPKNIPMAHIHYGGDRVGRKLITINLNNGNILREMKYVFVGEPNEGLFSFSKSGEGSGLMNYYGEVVQAPSKNISYHGKFNYGLAPMKIINLGGVYYVNKEGEGFFGPFISGSSFEDNGFAKIKLAEDEPYTWIDFTGKICIDPKVLAIVIMNQEDN